MLAWRLLLKPKLKTQATTTIENLNSGGAGVYWLKALASTDLKTRGFEMAAEQDDELVVASVGGRRMLAWRLLLKPKLKTQAAAAVKDLNSNGAGVYWLTALASTDLKTMGFEMAAEQDDELVAARFCSGS
ncbi:hypothetical protein Droror1_Dr00002700 [Drosera rotundifolia]